MKEAGLHHHRLSRQLNCGLAQSRKLLYTQQPHQQISVTLWDHRLGCKTVVPHVAVRNQARK